MGNVLISYCLWCRSTDDYPQDGVVYQVCERCIDKLTWLGRHGTHGPDPKFFEADAVVED